jgi:hypothetical protein
MSSVELKMRLHLGIANAVINPCYCLVVDGPRSDMSHGVIVGVLIKKPHSISNASSIELLSREITDRTKQRYKHAVREA